MIKLSPQHHFAAFFKREEEQPIQPYAYAVSKQLAQGSICLDLEESEKGDKQKTFEGFKEEDFIPLDLESLVKEESGVANLVGSEDELDKPFILHRYNFYITRYFKYETQIIDGIKSFIKTGGEKKQHRLSSLKSSNEFRKLIESRDKDLETDWQLVASTIAFLNNFSIITGGPGTGKTTTVAKVLSLLYEENPELIVKLAAPTGKAAMRMKESLANNKEVPKDYRQAITALQPYTLHRLLEYKYQSPYFKRNAEHPIDADVIIVDETSMIDVALFAKLIAAVKPETRLILLGDQNQLASVEAGSLLGDLCNTVENKNQFSVGLHSDLKRLLSEQELNTNKDDDQLLQDNLVELQHSYRFDENPDFIKISEAVISNNKTALKAFFTENSDEKKIIVDQAYNETLFKNFIKGYEAYIEEEDIAKAIEKLNELRILSVIRHGNQGVAGLNAQVEKYLQKKGRIDLSHVFYENRPVMVTRNHPELNLFNGDVGIVRKDKEFGKMKIWFINEEKNVKSYFPGLLTEVETVYAMTVHKSQGSEFNQVLLVMPKSEEVPILTRELLYTGITRAKQKLTIRGTKEVIMKASEGRVMRASGITNRI